MKDKILFALNAICKNYTPGKKVVQKLIYLMERKGLEINLSYAIHFYGPYSSDLDSSLHSFENNHIIEIDTSRKTHYIKFISDDVNLSISASEEKIIESVVQIFGNKTPLDLEVITTTDFVVNNFSDAERLTKEEVIEMVKRVKGNKFTEQQIFSSIDLLRSEGFIKIIS